MTGIAVLLAALLFLLPVFSGGPVQAEENQPESETNETAPNMKSGDPKKRLCVVSYDEYIPFSRQLYYRDILSLVRGIVRDDFI